MGINLKFVALLLIVFLLGFVHICQGVIARIGAIAPPRRLDSWPLA